MVVEIVVLLQSQGFYMGFYVLFLLTSWRHRVKGCASLAYAM